MTDPIRVLFVCTANICRSPFMERYARSVVGDDVHVSSAGTYGLDAQPMSSEMLVELEARGLNADGFLSRPITAALVAESDLVITAERSHRQFVLDEHPAAFRKVLTLGQAVHGAGAIDPSTRGRNALSELARQRGSADPADDVADPYRRGAAAAASAAVQITAMLDRFLPVLLHPESAEGKPTYG